MSVGADARCAGSRIPRELKKVKKNPRDTRRRRKSRRDKSVAERETRRSRSTPRSQLAGTTGTEGLKKRKHFPSEYSFAICLISLAFPRREGDAREKKKPPPPPLPLRIILLYYAFTTHPISAVYLCNQTQPTGHFSSVPLVFFLILFFFSLPYNCSIPFPRILFVYFSSYAFYV